MFKTRKDLEDFPTGLESRCHFSTEELQRLWIRFKALRNQETGLVESHVFCEMPEVALCPIAAAYIFSTQSLPVSPSSDFVDDQALEPVQSQIDSETFLRTKVEESAEDYDDQAAKLHANEIQSAGDVNNEQRSVQGLDFETFISALSPLSPHAKSNEKLHYLLQSMGISDDSTSVSRRQYQHFMISILGSHISPTAIDAMADSVFGSYEENLAGSSGMETRNEIDLRTFAIKVGQLDYASHLTINF